MHKKLPAFILGLFIMIIAAGCGKTNPASPVVPASPGVSTSTPPAQAQEFLNQANAYQAAATSVTPTAQTCIYKLTNPNSVPLTLWYTDNNQWKQETTTAASWQKQVTLTAGFYFYAGTGQPWAPGAVTNMALSLYVGAASQVPYASVSTYKGADMTLQGIFQ